jgi:hypothetical protein
MVACATSLQDPSKADKLMERILLTQKVWSPGGYVPRNGQVPEAIQATIEYRANSEAEVIW